MGFEVETELMARATVVVNSWGAVAHREEDLKPVKEGRERGVGLEAFEDFCRLRVVKLAVMPEMDAAAAIV